MKTTLLMPVLNEIEGMKAVFPRIKKEWVDEVIVVDGGSTDGSLEYAQRYGYRTLRQKSKGVPGAEWEGVQAAQGDVIITFSPDGNSLPERIPELVKKMEEGYDMVIVSRYFNGAKSYDDTPVTRFGNWMFTKMINFLFGGHYTDTLVMFRAWRKEILNTFKEGGEPQLSIECAKQKRRVTEIPGDEPKRVGGKAKMRPLRNGWWALSLIVRELLSAADHKQR